MSGNIDSNWAAVGIARSSGGNLLALLGRAMISTIFLFSGVGKIGGASATIAYIASTGMPLPEVGLASAIAIEIGGGLALLLGYRTRLVAGGLSLFCLFTAALFHNTFSDQNQLIHFLKNLAMAGGLLQIVVSGAGRYSLDARRR